jgi:uncharacterized protein
LAAAMNAARASLLALMLCWAFAAFADVAVPPLVGRVVDRTGTLSSDEIASLNQTLRNFEARKGSQVAVLIVPTTEPETIEQYSLRVAETWKIGRKKIDDGALLVVAKDDRKLRIEVGYGLEGALTDAASKRIIDEIITPSFRSGNFAGGIFAGVARIIRVIEGETLPPPPAPLEPQPRFNSANFDLFYIPLVLIGLLMVGAILRAALSRLAAAVVMAGLVALIAWFVVGIWLLSVIAAIFAFLVMLLAEPTTPGLSDSGWSGGDGSYSGSSSSGSSSPSDSESDSGGGGGSSGGGGASGSW